MQDTDIALKKIAKGAGIFLIGLFISKILAYVYRLIIARTGVEQYGLISLAMAVFNILIIFSLLGLSEGVIRFVSFYKGKFDQRRIKGTITSALKITLPLSLVSGTFLFFAADWIAITFFHDKSLGLLFKIFAFGIPFDSLRTVFFNSIKSFQKVEYEVYGKSIAENITKVILTWIIVYLGFGVIWAAAAYIASIFISFVLSFYFLEKKVFPIIATKIISISSNKDLLIYSVPLLFTNFIFLIIQWTDTLMLGNLRSISEVGIYNVALPTSALLYIFPSAIRTLFFPVLSEFYAQNKKYVFKSVYQTVVKWVLAVNSIIFVFLIIFSYQIICILFGKVYTLDKIAFLGRTIPSSVLTLIILSFSMFFVYTFLPSKDILMVLKKTKFIFLNTVVGSILNVILNYFLIPFYGIIGAAIATGISYFIIGMMTYIEAYLITKINPFKANCIKVIVTAVSMLFIMGLFKVYLISNIFYLILTSLIFLLLYFVLLLITKTFEKEDVEIIKAVEHKLNINIGISKLFGRFI